MAKFDFVFLGSKGQLSGYNNSITSVIGQFFMGGNFIGPLPFDGLADLPEDDLSVTTRRDYAKIDIINKPVTWV